MAFDVELGNGIFGNLILLLFHTSHLRYDPQFYLQCFLTDKVELDDKDAKTAHKICQNSTYKVNGVYVGADMGADNVCQNDLYKESYCEQREQGLPLQIDVWLLSDVAAKEVIHEPIGNHNK